MKRRRFLQYSAAAAAAVSLPAALLSNRVLAALQAMSEVPGDVLAVRGDGSEIALPRGDIEELGQSLRGRLLLPGNVDYEVARRVRNPVIDLHPALVVQPSGVADIRTAVNFARDNQLLLAVKCGGHSWSGKSTCESGMQIDLSGFRNVRVDPATRMAYAAGGSLLGELDHESMALGLVTTAGTVSHTGIAGLTLGGGFGRLARRFGLSLDNLKAVDVVTADGQLRHASAVDNPGLYWGVRGGGGNFGVVTSFELQLHPMQRQVVAGGVVYPLGQAREVFKRYAEVAAGAPDDLCVDLVMASPLGSRDGVVMMHACYSGPQEQAERVLAPLRTLGTPLNDSLKAVDYVALQRAGDDTDARTNGSYTKGGFVNEISDALIDKILDAFEPVAERGTTVLLQHAGGAIGRVPEEATAFAQRQALANLLMIVSWPATESAEPHVRWVTRAWAGLEPFCDGWYTNEVAHQSRAVVNQNYGVNYPRLLQVKNQYDPGNLFRLNANITAAV